MFFKRYAVNESGSLMKEPKFNFFNITKINLFYLLSYAFFMIGISWLIVEHISSFNNVLAASVSFWIAISLIFISITKPYLAFQIILFARPSIDVFTEQVKLQITGSQTTGTGGLINLLMVLICAMSLFNKQDLSVAKKMFPYFLLILATTIFGCMISPAKGEAAKVLLREMSYFAVFIIVIANCKNEKDVANLLKIMMFSATIPIAVALYEWWVTLGVSALVPHRIKGTFAHPNILGYYLAFLISVLITNKEFLNIGKIKWYLLLLSSIVVMIYTYSRGSLLVIIFLLALFFWATDKRRFTYICIIALLLAVFGPLKERVMEMFTASFVHPTAQTAVGWRYLYWQQMWPRIFDAPLFGQGIASFRDLGKAFTIWQHDAHNLFLELLIERGFVGFSIFVLTFLILFQKIYQIFRAAQDRIERNLALWGISSFSFLFIGGMVANIWHFLTVQWYWFALLGCIFSLHSRTSRSYAPE